MGIDKGLAHLIAEYMPKGTAEGMGRLLSVANKGTFVNHQHVFAAHVNEFNNLLKTQPSVDPNRVPIVPQPLDPGQTHFKKVAGGQYVREAYMLQHEETAQFKKQHIASRGKQGTRTEACAPYLQLGNEATILHRKPVTTRLFPLFNQISDKISSPCMLYPYPFLKQGGQVLKIDATFADAKHIRIGNEKV
jgi:hypothetical protein